MEGGTENSPERYQWNLDCSPIIPEAHGHHTVGNELRRMSLSYLAHGETLASNEYLEHSFAKVKRKKGKSNMVVLSLGDPLLSHTYAPFQLCRTLSSGPDAAVVTCSGLSMQAEDSESMVSPSPLWGPQMPTTAQFSVSGFVCGIKLLTMIQRSCASSLTFRLPQF